MTDERMTISIDGGVADVRMNRPEKISALDNAQSGAIVDDGESLKRERAVHAVVLTGGGRGFCAGLDFGTFQRMAGGASADDQSGEKRPARNIGDLQGSITHLAQQASGCGKNSRCR